MVPFGHDAVADLGPRRGLSSTLGVDPGVGLEALDRHEDPLSLEGSVAALDEAVPPGVSFP